MKKKDHNVTASDAEAAILRQRIADLEQAESRYYRLSEAWRELWAQYEAIIDAFDGLIYICSKNYEVEFMNRRFIERTGYYPLGQKCYKALHDLDDICPWCVNEQVFRGEKVTWEVLSPKDNRWYYVVNTPIRYAGEIISKMAMIQDISERKQAEKALQVAEAGYRSIFENAVEGIFQSTPKGRLLNVNPALAKMFGYDSPEDMVTSIIDLGHQIFVKTQQRVEYRRKLEESGVVRGQEYQVCRKDRSTFWVLVNARAVRDEGGTTTYYEGFVQDITDRKQETTN
jgi:PAS domain S-box-containing protein